jgi:hypothetical protein
MVDKFDPAIQLLISCLLSDFAMPDNTNFTPDLDFFVGDLLSGSIQAWVNRVIHADFRHRLDREQIANDSAFAIYQYLSKSNFIANIDVHEFVERARRLSRSITVRVTLDAIRYAKRRSRLTTRIDFCGSSIADRELHPMSIYDFECQDLLVCCTADWLSDRKRILDFRMRGFGNVAIAKALQISMRQLQRILKGMEHELVQALTNQRINESTNQRINKQQATSRFHYKIKFPEKWKISRPRCRLSSASIDLSLEYTLVHAFLATLLKTALRVDGMEIGCRNANEERVEDVSRFFSYAEKACRFRVACT